MLPNRQHLKPLTGSRERSW